MMGALLPHLTGCPVTRAAHHHRLLLSPCWAAGQLGQWASQWQGGEDWQACHCEGAGVRRPTCPPALTPGQTSPRSSGTSSPPHHSCPHVLTSLFSTHALVSAQEA